MCSTYAVIKVHNKEKTNVKELNLLVDTGSTYTCIITRNDYRDRSDYIKRIA